MLLVFISKKSNNSKISDYRSIVLCNMIRKLLAKVLANRIREQLEGLVDQE